MALRTPLGVREYEGEIVRERESKKEQERGRERGKRLGGARGTTYTET